MGVGCAGIAGTAAGDEVLARHSSVPTYHFDSLRYASTSSMVSLRGVSNQERTGIDPTSVVCLDATMLLALMTVFSHAIVSEGSVLRFRACFTYLWVRVQGNDDGSGRIIRC